MTSRVGRVSRENPDALEAVRSPFTVRVDTREQAPYRFTGLQSDDGRPLVVPIATGLGLATGDYSIVGLEDRVSIERKSQSDWFGSIGSGRERFEREMERLAEMTYAAVVIECGWDGLIINLPNSTQVSPRACSRTIISWSMRYGVHFWPMPSRRFAEVWTFGLLSMYWRQHQASISAIVSEVASDINS